MANIYHLNHLYTFWLQDVQLRFLSRCARVYLANPTNKSRHPSPILTKKTDDDGALACRVHHTTPIRIPKDMGMVWVPLPIVGGPIVGGP